MKKGLDLNQVSRVLDEVRKLQVKEFLKFKVKKKTSLSSMVVKGKNKKLLFELVWDPSFDRKGNMWVLRSSLSSETLGVSELSFKPLTEVPWFKVSTEKPSKINPDTDER